MNTGDLTENHPRFQFQPLTNDQDDIEALALNILGVRFVLLLEPQDVGKYPFLREAKYRPGRIVISHPSSTNWITMSWDDGKAHEPGSCGRCLNGLPKDGHSISQKSKNSGLNRVVHIVGVNDPMVPRH